MSLDRLLADRPLVVHLAAQPGVLGSFGTGFDQYLHDNLLATQRLFEAAAEAGCPRVVYASSSSVYGDAEAYPCSEDATPTRPRSPYGVTKRACEKLAEIYAGMGLPTVGMRYFTVYGPRQRPDMAIRRLCEAATGGPRFTLRGDGSQIRDFTHVEDAVDATVRALTAERPYPVLNIGGGVQASMTEVIRELGRLTGKRVPVDRQAAQIGDVRRTAGDTSRARDEPRLAAAGVAARRPALRAGLGPRAPRGRGRRRPHRHRADRRAGVVTTVTPLRVAVLGQGYVGLPLAMRAVAAGHDVVGFDASTDRVKRLAAGDSFVEDVPDGGAGGGARAAVATAVTDDALACAGFDVAVITVPTPLREGAPDLSYIEAAARTLAPATCGRAPRSMLESTTYPGTTEELFVPILEAGSGLSAGVDFHLGYSPERIDPGNRDLDAGEHAEGRRPASTRRRWTAVDAFYATIVDRPCRCPRRRAAELAKLLENTFRHVNIALVNELAMFAARPRHRRLGGHRRGRRPSRSGSCGSPRARASAATACRSTRATCPGRVRAARSAASFRFVELANDINDHMPDYVVRRLMRALNEQGVALVPGPVLLLGLAYKRNAGDARESPAVALINRLIADGAEVAVRRPARGRADADRRADPAGRAHRAGADAGGRGGAGDRPRRLRLRPGDRARSPGAGHQAPAGRSQCRAALAGRASRSSSPAGRGCPSRSPSTRSSRCTGPACWPRCWR